MVLLRTGFTLALEIFASAIPVEDKKRSQIGSLSFSSHIKSDASAKNIFKSDKSRIQSFASAASKVGEAPATNEVVSYVAVTTVGSQTFNLIVDTGSSNTWVGAGTKYKAGSTSVNTGKSVSVSYGSGSSSGTEYTDTVSLGGVTVTAQSIGVASRSSGFSGVDGIIGFGPEDLTEGTVSGVSEVPTFLQNLVSQGQVPSNVLGIYFKPESGRDTADVNGELSLGGTDSSKYTGSITYTSVTSTSPYSLYWGITVSSITYGSTSLSGSAPAIVDTGTTLIYIPSAAYTKFLSSGGGGKTDSSSGLAYFTTEPTGTVTFTIGGAALTLTPSQYIIPSAQLASLGLASGRYWSWIANGGSTTADVNFIIQGQKFLENYYSVFNTTNKRVGFATRA